MLINRLIYITATDQSKEIHDVCESSLVYFTSDPQIALGMI